MSSTWSEAGYASAAYLQALGQTPLPFGATGGHLVQRAIGDTGLTDLAGAYPLFTCPDWSALAQAVADLPQGPVSLTLVADPFASETANLDAIFPICRKLHDHWIIDLTQPLTPSKHHRHKLRHARPTRIEGAPADPALGPAWAGLYAHLIAKKSIRDARAFSASSLAAQLAVPGAHLVTAWEGESLLGADLYYLDRGRAFAHLSAYAPEGYDRSVSFPMLAAAVDYFRPLAVAIDLGGAPSGPAGQGMAQFKAGWTRLTRPSHLCGKVLDPAAYARLASSADLEGYFPAYRVGEFRTAPSPI
jgi:hypothetical protein